MSLAKQIIPNEYPAKQEIQITSQCDPNQIKIKHNWMEPRNSHPDQINALTLIKKSSGKNNTLFFIYKGNATPTTSIDLSFVSCFSTY